MGINLKVFIAAAALCAASGAMASDFVTSPTHPSVKFKIDGCTVDLNRFTIYGWYVSDTYPGKSELHISFKDGDKYKEVPLKKWKRPDASEALGEPGKYDMAGFNGSLPIKAEVPSMIADIMIVEGNSSNPIYYRCN